MSNAAMQQMHRLFGEIAWSLKMAAGIVEKCRGMAGDAVRSFAQPNANRSQHRLAFMGIDRLHRADVLLCHGSLPWEFMGRH
ncbi:hypothetical protein AVO45_10130 [Ruegeria marisrubri]|uniref:Uncharacterized protein n=1 Tax=Ruegeria marisrubri TaxID=1685379 RepID=A0A0X3TM52_9RHOB|nr:hypothetical protein AVO45_10130 [Ruegeria marisrubri]